MSAQRARALTRSSTLPPRLALALSGLALGAALVVSPARAEDVEAVLKEAAAHFAAGRYAEAEVGYRKAYARAARLDTAGALGQCLYEQGKLAEAAHYLSQAVRLSNPREKKERHKALVELRDKAAKGLAAVVVAVDVVGAKILVNGVEVGTAPDGDPFFLRPGTHEVAAVRAEGGAKVASEVVLELGREASVTLELSKAPVTPAPSAATSAPSAAPLAPKAAPSAAPAATSSAPTKPPSTPPSGGANTGVLVAGGALAGVAAVVGVVGLVVAGGKEGEAATLRAQYDPRSPSEVDTRTRINVIDADHRAMTTLGVWSLVGAGVVGGATLVYALASGGKKAPSTGQVRVQLAPTSVTFSLRY